MVKHTQAIRRQQPKENTKKKKNPTRTISKITNVE